jgi:hypothetical protein
LRSFSLNSTTKKYSLKIIFKNTKMLPRKSTTKQGYMPQKSTILKKSKILLPFFWVIFGCETIKPLRVQNPWSQSFAYESNPETIERVIQFLIEKKIEIKTMAYNTIICEKKVYATTVFDQNQKSSEKAHFLANCLTKMCPVVSFTLCVQITRSKVNIFYNNVDVLPKEFSVTPTFRITEELESFLKN